MQYEWDYDKDSINIAKHGVSLAIIETFEWGSARVVIDDRRNYGETRYIANGFIQERLHIIIFTLRNDIAVRVISVRKANKREIRSYYNA